MAHYLLDKYFEPGQKLLDPMAGGKTVETQGNKLGIYVVSNDLQYEKGWDVMQGGGWPFKKLEFHGVVLHPPYFRAKKYSDDERDLGNITDYWTYIMALEHLMREAKRVTMAGGYIILIIGDHRKGDRIRLVHSDIYYLSTMNLGLPLENYDLWEISATGTPFISTKHMIMLNWCMAFRRPLLSLEEFVADQGGERPE